MKKQSISIIVPVHNTNIDILKECVASLKNDIYLNEIIIIDDGSDAVHSKEYMLLAEKNNYVFIVQDNKGVSGARNKGIEVATGDFVLFMDSDDYLKLDYFKHANDAFHKEQIEIYVPGKQLLRKKGSKDLLVEKEGILKLDDKTKNDIALNNDKYAVSGTMFKRKMIGGDRFDEDLNIGEDTLFFATSLIKAHAYMSRAADYVYRRTGNNSITSANGINAAIDYYDQNVVFCNRLTKTLGIEQDILKVLLAKKRYEALTKIIKSDGRYEVYKSFCKNKKNKKIPIRAFRKYKCGIIKKALIYIAANYPSAISYPILRIKGFIL